MNSLAKGFVLGDWGRRKVCMLACHSFHIYGTWRSKEGGGFKVIIWEGKTQRGPFFMGEVDSYHERLKE